MHSHSTQDLDTQTRSYIVRFSFLPMKSEQVKKNKLHFDHFALAIENQLVKGMEKRLKKYIADIRSGSPTLLLHAGS